jgi:acyl-CoA dehydrogenase family protein 9
MSALPSVAKSLFFGVLSEDSLHPFPSFGETEAAKVRKLLDRYRRFADKNLDPSRIDAEQAIPESVYAELGEQGLWGMAVPTEDGGLGLSHRGRARVIEEVAASDTALGTLLGMHTSIGSAGILSSKVRGDYAGRMARGACIGAFALAESGAGSDASAIQTRADESQGDYILNGAKAWVASGDSAQVFTVFARTSAKDEDAKPRLTAFVVPKDATVSVEPTGSKLGLRGLPTPDVRFSGTRVSAANIIGEPGKGFKVAMDLLNHGRLMLSAGCVGAAKRMLKLSLARCQEREAFARPIGEFGLIKDKIASMMAEIFALESCVYLTAGLIDRGMTDASVESVMCKVMGSETLWRVSNEALQIVAGHGFATGSPYERAVRDARAMSLLEGTNEVLRCYIALSGMQAPGNEITEVAKAMREPIKGFGLLSDFALRKAKSALGRERMTQAHPVLAREAVVLEEYSQDLARNVDKTLRKHGKNIAEMQYTQRRIADMAMDLFGIAAVVSRGSLAIARKGEEGSRREIDLASIFVSSAERRLEASVRAFDKNDDEVRKACASRAYVDGAYPCDVL